MVSVTNIQSGSVSCSILYFPAVRCASVGFQGCAFLGSLDVSSLCSRMSSRVTYTSFRYSRFISVLGKLASRSRSPSSRSARFFRIHGEVTRFLRSERSHLYMIQSMNSALLTARERLTVGLGVVEIWPSRMSKELRSPPPPIRFALITHYRPRLAEIIALARRVYHTACGNGDMGEIPILVVRSSHRAHLFPLTYAPSRLSRSPYSLTQRACATDRASWRFGSFGDRMCQCSRFHCSVPCHLHLVWLVLMATSTSR